MSHLLRLLQQPQYETLRTNLLVWATQRSMPGLDKQLLDKLTSNEEVQPMLAENMQIWRENVFAEGEAKGIMSVVMNMLKKQFSISEISEATGYSVPEVERLAAEHQHDKQ